VSFFLDLYYLQLLDEFDCLADFMLFLPFAKLVQTEFECPTTIAAFVEEHYKQKELVHKSDEEEYCA